MAGLPPPPINDKPGSFTWMEWYRQLRNYVSTSGSVPWYIINFAGSNITDIALRAHNDLQSVQGGTAGERNHLTNAELSLLTQRTYGEMYANNAGVTVTIPVVDTWYPITTGFTSGTNLNTTFKNNHELVVTKAGKYHIQWSISTEISAANQDTEYGISVNNVVQTNTVAHLHFQNTNSELCAASGGIVTLAANDVLRFVLRNRTGTTSIKMEHASLTLVRIDN